MFSIPYQGVPCQDADARTLCGRLKDVVPSLELIGCRIEKISWLLVCRAERIL